MTVSGWLEILVFSALLIALSPILGGYLAKVYTGERVFLTPVFGWFERGLYRSFGVNPKREQDWKSYAKSLIIFSLAGWLLLYLILRTQTLDPWNNYAGVKFYSAPWNVTFNTVSSFLTNTNWQFYSGEDTMTYFSQMVGLTVQQYASAAVGIVVAVALIRGIVGRSGKSLGNFYSDLVRTILYVLLPMSFVSALVLLSQGTIDNISHYVSVHGISGVAQTIAMGPVASMEAIKDLGSNGGGFFDVNAAHPFENPNGFTNFYIIFMVLITPAALV
ncbi:MAG: potassium-transporting ATPase subunit KdpA, partial [Solirubrobacteraceae bacterium]